MKPIETETCNGVYTLEGCNDLPVTKYTNTNNNEEGVESCWELTPSATCNRITDIFQGGE